MYVKIKQFAKPKMCIYMFFWDYGWEMAPQCQVRELQTTYESDHCDVNNNTHQLWNKHINPQYFSIMFKQRCLFSLTSVEYGKENARSLPVACEHSRNATAKLIYYRKLSLQSTFYSCHNKKIFIFVSNIYFCFKIVILKQTKFSDT